jgi:PadR family transcriptional regulator PadR
MRYTAKPATMRHMVPRQTEDRLLTQMRRGTLEYCVLAVLRKDERYAFDLVKTLAQIDGMVTSEGTLYPLLTRLRRDGLVSSAWKESSQGPPRRYYRITAKGTRALDDFTQEWRRFRSSVDHLIEGNEDR